MNTVTTIVARSVPAGVEALVASIAAGGLPADARPVSEGRRSRLYYCRTAGGDAVPVRAWRVHNLLRSFIQGWRRRSYAHTHYHNLLRLRRRGIGAPEPYAYIEERTRLRRLVRCYCVSSATGSEWQDLVAIDTRDDADALVSALAAFMAHVHRAGVCVGRMRPQSVAFRTLPVDADDIGPIPEGAEDDPVPTVKYEFMLLDLSRLRFGVTDVRVLAASCAGLLTGEHARLIFLETYAPRLGIDAGEAADLLLPQ